MDSLTKIEIRKIVPIAAMISAGKTKLLNVLFNIDFLHCGAGIATQFVNILRYNPKINSPRFYHLKLIQKDDDYLFFIDPKYEIKIGEEVIAEENKRINEELKAIKKRKKEINYKDIFYITEVKDVEFLKDKEYLKTHDFCDIPGLSEFEENNQDSQNKTTLNDNKNINDFNTNIKLGDKFGVIYRPKKAIYSNKNKKNLSKNNGDKSGMIETKEEIKKKNKKNIEEKEDNVYYETEVKRNTYLFEIFSIIKNKIDGVIILLSIENYYFDENFSIITKLYKVIQKEITNCLVILNKIDKSSNPKEDIDKCRGYFMKKFPNCKTFNLSSNIFISLSAFQLQNELLMNKSYKHLIRYHFYNYLKIFRLQKSINIIYDKTFIDHLKDILTKIRGINKREFEEKIEDLNNSEDIDIFNKAIKKFTEEINKEFGADGIKLGIEEDLDEFEEPSEDNYDNNISSFKALDIMKIFYIYHKKNEYIPPLSAETKQLLNYFKITYTKKVIPKFDIDKLNSKTQLNKDIIKALKDFSKKIGNFKIDNKKIRDLMYEIQKTIEYLKTYNVIFIPFLGASNAGKTTIINGIIGKNLLPNEQNECTKRGIIIRYSKNDEITLRKALFQSEQFLERKNYFFQADRAICRGEEQVKEALKGINYFFNEKEEDSFYYIRTKIKLFDEIGLNDSMKEMIYLIDFPGYGTGNIFEKEIYKKVMSICNSFVFVLRNSVIKDNDTKKTMDLLFSESKGQKKELASKFIKSSLFVLNNEINQTTTQTDLENAKGEICSILNLKERKNINLCFFNAKYYLNYCNNKNYYSNIEQLIDSEYKNYDNNRWIIYTNPGSIKSTMNSSFCEFFYNELKNKIGDFNKSYKAIAKEQAINESISSQIDKKFEKIQENENFGDFKKYENYIKKFLSFCFENINQLKTLKESNINQFKEKFSIQINNYYKIMQEELKRKIDYIIVLLDMFFKSDYEDKKKDSNEINTFNSNIKNIKDALLSLIKNNNSTINEFINDYRENIKKSLEKKKESIEEQLKNKNYNIILEEINNEMVSNLENFNKKIKEYLDRNEEESYKCFVIAKRHLEAFSKEKSNYLKLDNKLKQHISKSIGDVEKDLEKEIFKEIKDSCESSKNILYKKGFKDWFYSLFSSKYYLEKIIDMMIETFLDKINRIFEVLLENTNVYINDLERNIDHCATFVTLEFTKEQLEIWNELKKNYEETREIIIKIKGIN